MAEGGGGVLLHYLQTPITHSYRLHPIPPLSKGLESGGIVHDSIQVKSEETNERKAHNARVPECPSPRRHDGLIMRQKRKKRQAKKRPVGARLPKKKVKQENKKDYITTIPPSGSGAGG